MLSELNQQLKVNVQSQEQGEQGNTIQDRAVHETQLD